MESPQERRERETLERCTTQAQRETCQRLHSQGKTAYPESRQGKTVIAEFRRYCETFDPEKIGQGLYRFSTGGAGGLDEIAHYNLHGFRHVFRHPIFYIDELLVPRVARWPEARRVDPNGYHSYYVYTDGMTAGEVAFAIIDLAAEHRDRVLADYTRKRDAAALAEAERLAESVGMQVVPR